MKRALTLTGGILGIVGDSIFALLLLIGLVAVGRFFGFLIIIPIIFLLLAIAGLILSIFVTISYKKEPALFKKRYGVIITSIVFNFVISLYLMITMFNTFGVYVFLYFILFGVVLTSAILNLVDICRENGRVKKMETKENDVVEVKPATSRQVSSKKVSETFETKVEKLKKMLDEGLIDEEEFKQLKMNYIKQEINK